MPRRNKVQEALIQYIHLLKNYDTMKDEVVVLRQTIKDLEASKQVALGVIKEQDAIIKELRGLE
jgi:hypothetical protein